MLDFLEIPRANSSNYQSDKFEFFAEEFFESLGFSIESAPGRGADGGRDLIVSEIIPSHITPSRRRWLVSCKHSVHSNRAISKKDELEILDRVKRHQCDGFIGFYSLTPTQDLISYFEQLSKDVPCVFFTYARIEKKLTETDLGVAIAKRYFPRSSTDFCKNMVLEVDNNLKKISIKCSNCGSSINGAPTTVSAWGYDIENGGSHTETFDYFCSDDCEIDLNALAEQCFFDDERDFGFWSSSFGELITYEGLIEFNQNFGVNGKLVSTSTEAAKKNISHFTEFLMTKHIFG
ncbi:restriction endonuclease [Vibrio cholerae]|uniref:restriction endonuclease n=1 Tax=Vibrio cholerae TaxID=666 RepID=UPI00155E2D21|nr:restriction endonuclease [Vibrio cholerae]NOE62807.1 hypothetical protein [Vibrio cholerae]